MRLRGVWATPPTVKLLLRKERDTSAAVPGADYRREDDVLVLVVAGTNGRVNVEVRA